MAGTEWLLLAGSSQPKLYRSTPATDPRPPVAPYRRMSITKSPTRHYPVTAS